eukprot:GHVQ01035180.1.p1 GENE.GHVQ01035180.1~~GHVQ01035180.1.p1  ORF type:complete len:855 (+),score=218.02 GHVQ01035180.1:418-2982(+)
MWGQQQQRTPSHSAVVLPSPSPNPPSKNSFAAATPMLKAHTIHIPTQTQIHTHSKPRSNSRTSTSTHTHSNTHRITLSNSSLTTHTNTHTNTNTHQHPPPPATPPIKTPKNSATVNLPSTPYGINLPLFLHTNTLSSPTFPASTTSVHPSHVLPPSFLPTHRMTKTPPVLSSSSSFCCTSCSHIQCLTQQSQLIDSTSPSATGAPPTPTTTNTPPHGYSFSQKQSHTPYYHPHVGNSSSSCNGSNCSSNSSNGSSSSSCCNCGCSQQRHAHSCSAPTQHMFQASCSSCPIPYTSSHSHNHTHAVPILYPSTSSSSPSSSNYPSPSTSFTPPSASSKGYLTRLSHCTNPPPPLAQSSSPFFPLSTHNNPSASLQRPLHHSNISASLTNAPKLSLPTRLRCTPSSPLHGDSLTPVTLSRSPLQPAGPVRTQDSHVSAPSPPKAPSSPSSSYTPSSSPGSRSVPGTVGTGVTLHSISYTVGSQSCRTNSSSHHTQQSSPSARTHPVLVLTQSEIVAQQKPLPPFSLSLPPCPPSSPSSRSTDCSYLRHSVQWLITSSYKLSNIPSLCVDFERDSLCLPIPSKPICFVNSVTVAAAPPSLSDRPTFAGPCEGGLAAGERGIPGGGQRRNNLARAEPRTTIVRGEYSASSVFVNRGGATVQTQQQQRRGGGGIVGSGVSVSGLGGVGGGDWRRQQQVYERSRGEGVQSSAHLQQQPNCGRTATSVLRQNLPRVGEHVELRDQRICQQQRTRHGSAPTMCGASVVSVVSPSSNSSRGALSYGCSPRRVHHHSNSTEFKRSHSVLGTVASTASVGSPVSLQHPQLQLQLLMIQQESHKAHHTHNQQQQRNKQQQQRRRLQQ